MMTKDLIGSLLVATRNNRDPYFAHSVVLIASSDITKDFICGVVLNKKMCKCPDCGGELRFTTFEGGPMPTPGLLLVHNHQPWAYADRPASPVEGLYYGYEKEFEFFADHPVSDISYRIFSGYSGWSFKQLDKELKQGLWRVIPATSDLIVNSDPEMLWEQLTPAYTIGYEVCLN